MTPSVDVGFPPSVGSRRGFNRLLLLGLLVLAALLLGLEAALLSSNHVCDVC